MAGGDRSVTQRRRQRGCRVERCGAFRRPRRRTERRPRRIGNRLLRERIDMSELSDQTGMLGIQPRLGFTDRHQTRRDRRRRRRRVRTHLDDALHPLDHPRDLHTDNRKEGVSQSSQDRRSSSQSGLRHVGGAIIRGDDPAASRRRRHVEESVAVGRSSSGSSDSVHQPDDPIHGPREHDQDGRRRQHQDAGPDVRTDDLRRGSAKEESEVCATQRRNGEWTEDRRPPRLRPSSQRQADQCCGEHAEHADKPTVLLGEPDAEPLVLAKWFVTVPNQPPGQTGGGDERTDTQDEQALGDRDRSGL